MLLLCLGQLIRSFPDQVRRYGIASNERRIVHYISGEEGCIHLVMNLSRCLDGS